MTAPGEGYAVRTEAGRIGLVPISFVADVFILTVSVLVRVGAFNPHVDVMVFYVVQLVEKKVSIGRVRLFPLQLPPAFVAVIPAAPRELPTPFQIGREDHAPLFRLGAVRACDPHVPRVVLIVAGGSALGDAYDPAAARVLAPELAPRIAMSPATAGETLERHRALVRKDSMPLFGLFAVRA